MVNVRSNIRKTSRKSTRKSTRKPIRKTSRKTSRKTTCKTSRKTSRKTTKKTIHKTAKKIGGGCIKKNPIQIRNFNTDEYFIIKNPDMLINYIWYLLIQDLKINDNDKDIVINLMKIFNDKSNQIYDHLTNCNDGELLLKDDDLYKMIMRLNNVKNGYIRAYGERELDSYSNTDPSKIKDHLINLRKRWPN